MVDIVKSDLHTHRRKAIPFQTPHTIRRKAKSNPTFKNRKYTKTNSSVKIKIMNPVRATRSKIPSLTAIESAQNSQTPPKKMNKKYQS